MMDVLAAITRERLETADALALLSPDQWATRSSCDQWTVQDVAAHPTHWRNYSSANAALQLLEARGNLAKASAHLLAPR